MEGKTWKVSVEGKLYTLRSDTYRLYIVNPEDHDEGEVLFEWKHSFADAIAEKVINAALDALAEAGKPRKVL
jgi:hypothetical protein